MIQIKSVESIEELQGILELQAKNIEENLTQSEIGQEGFVTLKHDIEFLELMNSYERQIIAVFEGKVIGYALIMVQELRDTIPILVPMFQKLDSMTFKSQRISDAKYYVMGQVCIDIEFRGKGIFAKLYEKHHTDLAHKYDYCITEVAHRNPRSIRAHEKVGFKEIHSFSDETDNWSMIILELKSN
jgi:ribosomal protein S18 acetylase RimI-like enzyme